MYLMYFLWGFIRYTYIKLQVASKKIDGASIQLLHLQNVVSLTVGFSASESFSVRYLKVQSVIKVELALGLLDRLAAETPNQLFLQRAPLKVQSWSNTKKECMSQQSSDFYSAHLSVMNFVTESSFIIDLRIL